MKQLTALSLLFYTAFAAHADTTLVFKTDHRQKSHTLSYYIKDGMLRFNEDDADRINLYDSSRQAFVSIDQETGTIARIDADIIARRVEQLNQARLQKLAQAEADINKKIEAMPEKEQEIAVSVLNQLKYPEFYGAHTFLEVSPNKQPRSIDGVDCQLYDIHRQGKLLKQICMASPEKLGMDPDDYRTLRQFYRFNYATQTRLMIASGKTSFSYVDYEQENMPGVVVEISARTEQPDHANLRLQSLSSKMLDASLFEHKNTQKMD